MDLRRLLRGILNIWVLVGAVLFAFVLFGIVVLAVWFIRPGPGAAAPATPVFIVIAAPSATPLIPSPTPAQPEATPEVPPSPPPGTLAVGAYVQISGTGGDGLRVRSEPGLQGQVLFLALEAEVFLVADGPRDADGYTWWYLEAPAEKTRQGWAASNFLGVVQNP